jgi:hypothetical protein
MSFVDQIKMDLGSAHLRGQALRFGRLAGLSFGSQLAALGVSHLTAKVLLSVAVGAAEVGFRSLCPVVPWAQLSKRAPVVAPPAGPAAGGSGASA